MMSSLLRYLGTTEGKLGVERVDRRRPSARRDTTGMNPNIVTIIPLAVVVTMI